MSIEAMKWAIEVFLDRYSTADQAAEVIKALRQAIEQEEKKDYLTVAYMSGVYDGKKVKREWVGLTDEQINDIAEYHGIDGLYETSRIDFYRAIEAKLKEKNT